MARAAKAKDPRKVMDKVKNNGMDLDVAEEVKRGTNIQDVIVDPRQRVKIPTGKEFIDRILGDGMGPNAGTTGVISGGSGCGKTTVGLQIADFMHGMSRVEVPDFPEQSYEGCVCLYNTNEEAATQVKMSVERLRLKTGFIIGQDRLVPRALDHMDWLMKQPKNKGKKPILFLDSLQAMDDGFYDNGGTNSQTPVRIAQQTCAWVKKNFGIIFLVGHVNKDGEFNGKNTLIHAVDFHLHLYFDKGKKSETFGERILECKKNRFGSSGGAVVVGMDKHTGLTEKEGFEVG